jgi:5-methylcytosine-specific restriction endonuclease McrA
MAKFQRKQVWQRAQGFCEYCRLSQDYSILPHGIDHIRAKKHHGEHSMENTCLACASCNAAKGSNAAGYDPETVDLVPLFTPRLHWWEEHFFW